MQRQRAPGALWGMDGWRMKSSPHQGQDLHLCTMWGTGEPAGGAAQSTAPSFPVQVCHHTDCQQLHHRGPLNLCEACDCKFHSTMHYDGHIRFDLPPQGECRRDSSLAARAPGVAQNALSGHSVLVTVRAMMRTSEGQELTVNNETQLCCGPFCSTFLSERKSWGTRCRTPS